MPELRWTLLAVGALFIGVLAWWERRKPRQSLRSGNEPTMSDQPAPHPHREPTFSLPEMRAREPVSPQDLPVLAIDDEESPAGLRIEGRRVEEDVTLEDAASLESPEPVVPAAPVAHAVHAVHAELEQPEVGPVMRAEPETRKQAPTAQPVVEWPADEERRIVALRIVSASPERFSGRVVRTALAAEGFQLGKYSIFHKPDAQGRAQFSAASLSKPGSFDLETMDTQRFGGLSLFAVLPGPKPARETFEDLLAVARNLNERLHGGLQDERGGPLTPGRIVEIREALGPLAVPAHLQGHSPAHLQFQEPEETP